MIAREALVDCAKKTRVLSTKGDSVTKSSAVPVFGIIYFYKSVRRIG